MERVFFKPWVGSRYGKADSVFDKKILVLGDSHYCEEGCVPCGIDEKKEQCGNFTTEVIRDYLDYNVKGTWKRTFTKFMNSFVGGTDYHRDEFWESVSFYNYLQIAAGNNSRQTRSYDYNQERHKAALLEVISSLDPDVIVCWGNNVWDAMPEDIGWGRGFLSKEFSCCFVYPFKDRELKFIGITHPSSSYKSSQWTSVFGQLGVNK